MGNVCSAFCIGCTHYYYDEFRVNLCCNYLFDTGHMRPCPAGDGCCVKSPVKSSTIPVKEKLSKKYVKAMEKEEIV